MESDVTSDLEMAVALANIVTELQNWKLTNLRRE
jgi:hypothetical protein